MNDLVEHFNLECDPVSVNGKSISCLLYADDIVLMSQAIIVKKCPLILYLFSLNKSACLLTVSKAFFKSTKQAKRYLLFLKSR
jgi:hypothetical protein